MDATTTPAKERALDASTVERAPRALSLRRFGAWVVDLLNLLALRGKAALTWPSEGLGAALLALLAVGTWVVLDRREQSDGSVFYPYGASDFAWYLLGGLAIAWVFSRACRPRAALVPAIALCALGGWLAVLYFHLEGELASRWTTLALAIGAALYALAYLVQGGRSLTGRAQPLAAVATGVVALGFVWVSGKLSIRPTLWLPGAYTGDVAYDRHEVEPLLFAQPERVDDTVATVQPSDPAETEVYFVGFAGYGDQKVFAEEIKLAADVVDGLYQTASRSLLLLNDRRNVNAAPLATGSSLRRALRGVAGKMTLDDDVLFLALSSHGSPEWALRIRDGDLPLTDLSAQELDAALDEAGIVWRVIVISACYSGGFIEKLQDPYTIVLAAAAPDRKSFGCRADRDLTYFGEAFYRDALPAAASLRDAFEKTVGVVTKREMAESFLPSLPMAFFGEEIERKLASLDSRR